jgi:RNA polymerase sigma-70 factor, ECF subfamily
MSERSTEDEVIRLLVECQQRLAGYIRTLIPGHADADDVLQEVNLFIWRHATDYQPGTSFGAWVFQVARYHVLSFRGRQPRGPAV